MQRIILFVALMVSWVVSAADVSFQLHPAFKRSLFAQEPDVVDPVALTFDADGRVYVVEMRDYPYGIGPDNKPGGCVRLLEDTNWDGRADRSTVFAEDLSFPTSIAPWKDGVIVAAPPEIIYLADTNGDGRADVREVLLRGFTLGVTDSNVNGLRWGLDNQLHGLNGGNGGLIESTRRPGTPLPVRYLDFSFDPGSGRLQTTFHTSGGFGLVFTEWGDSFVTYNIDHIQQRIIPVRYLNRFPGLAPFKATVNISDHGDMAPIYPISTPATRPNHPEQSGHFSAAGGLGYFSAGLPGDLSGSVLVCDVVGNLVHRDRLVLDGPTYSARRSPEELTREFFASRDVACRPVGIETGPDGAYYLLDMQRDVIEHPDYIPEKLRRTLDIRAGEDRGRIYRLTLTNQPAGQRPRLSKEPSLGLIARLSDPNPWWRDTAQRLLVERRDPSIVPALRERFRQDKDPLGRLHILWTLQGLEAVQVADVLLALNDAHPGLRRAGLRLSESQLNESTPLRDRVLQLAEDEDVQVRFQCALALGEIRDVNTLPALSRILVRDLVHRWSRVAVYCSLRPGQETKLLQDLLANEALDKADPKARLEAVRELSELVGARTSDSLGSLLTLLKQQGDFQRRDAAATFSPADGLSGLADGLSRNAHKPVADAATVDALRAISAGPDFETLGKAWAITKALGLPDNEPQRAATTNAVAVLADPSRPQSTRESTVAVLRFASYADVADTCFAVLTKPEPTALQLAVVDLLGQYTEADVARRLLESWRSLQPQVRTRALDLLLRKPAFHDALLTAIETKHVSLGELNLDLEQRRRLLRRSSAANQARAAKFITDEEYGNRKVIVEEWLGKMPATGDAKAGRTIFEQRCATCHALRSVGHRVGPDLAAAAHRSVEDLLSNILDPNMAINPAYVAYTVDLKNGEVETGLLHAETSQDITLLQSEGRQVWLARRQIDRMQSSGLSLMPEGLENGLTPQQLRDLIALLQQQ